MNINFEWRDFYFEFQPILSEDKNPEEIGYEGFCENLTLERLTHIEEISQHKEINENFCFLKINGEESFIMVDEESKEIVLRNFGDISKSSLEKSSASIFQVLKLLREQLELEIERFGVNSLLSLKTDLDSPKIIPKLISSNSLDSIEKNFDSKLQVEGIKFSLAEIGGMILDKYAEGKIRVNRPFSLTFDPKEINENFLVKIAEKEKDKIKDLLEVIDKL